MDVTCGGSHPKPTGTVCFAFSTGTYGGGWQANNTSGCTITFDGAPNPAGMATIPGAGDHELEFSGCTDANVAWTCWN